MKQCIIAGTLALLMAMIFGAMQYDSLLLGFVSSDNLMQMIRVVTGGLLLGILVTSPPRSKYFRIALGVASPLLAIGSIYMMGDYYMAPLDTVVFIQVVVIFALEVLEVPFEQMSIYRYPMLIGQ